MSNFVGCIPVVCRTIHEIILWQEKAEAAHAQESAEAAKRKYSLTLRGEFR